MGISRFNSARISGNILLRYAIALAAVLTALLVCRGMNVFGADRFVYVLLLPAIAFSAWYCGIGPSVMAVSVALLGATYQLAPNGFSMRALTAGELVGVAAFVFSCVVIVVMGESRRRQNAALRNEQGELERKVRERTADLDVVNRNLRELSARLLQLQDDERRRIARELHDSVGQMLAALTMNLSAVRNDVERLAKTAAALTDSETLVREMSSEVRTISHLLHPPLLDEAGLSSALRWYVDGFAQRSGINVDLDLPQDLGRLPSELETAIFRVVQECLTNIHRHSESAVARIRLRHRDKQILVDVQDEGKGIPPEKRELMASSGTPGVGIRGMRERIRQLGGSLEIQSDDAGTLVAARLPVDEMPSTDSFALTDRSSTAAA
jgi:signal transduction histidine kinase